MPAVLMELGFINNDRDNRIFDEQFDEMVNAIVDGVEDAIPLNNSSGRNRRFGVQVGLFRHESNAAYLREQLESQGYVASIIRDDPYYAVVVGREPTLEDAADLQTQLRREGYDTLVVNM